MNRLLWFSSQPLVYAVYGEACGEGVTGGNTIFTHILAPLDGSRLAECVLPHAVALARGFDARLTVLHVIEPPPDGDDAAVDPLDWEMRKAEAEAYLETVEDKLRTAEVDVDLEILEGRAAESIVACVKERDVNLLVLSSHGSSGLTRWNVSSVTQKVILDAPTSLLLVRAYEAEAPAPTALRYTRILAPLDGSQRAECVLAGIDHLAGYYDAAIYLVHVVRRPEMPRNMPRTEKEEELYAEVTARNRTVARAYLEQVQGRLTNKSTVRLEESDDATYALHELAEEYAVDLVVLGAHGYSGSPKWPYGSVTTSFITYSSKPLLIVQDIAPSEIEPTPAQKAARQKAGH